MIYLKSLRESSDNSYSSDFLDIDSWYPEYSKFIDSLGEIDKKSVYLSHNLMQVLSNSEYMLSNLDVIKKFLDKVKNSEILNYTYQEYVSNTAHIYKRWGLLSKFDLDTFSEMNDIVQDVCDDSDCGYKCFQVSWSEVNDYIMFEYIIFDSDAIINHTSVIENSKFLSEKLIEKLMDDISRYNRKFNNMKCKISFFARVGSLKLNIKLSI